MAKKGETREKILNAATKVFFENGFEATSVKMILDEANVVTGSFYHFFPSKENLFENVVEKFLQNYTERMSLIFENDSVGVNEQFRLFMGEIKNVSKTYYRVLHGNQLHWTIQHALHNKTIESLLLPLSKLLERLMDNGTIESRINVDTTTLAAILIKGIEAIFHGNKDNCLEYYESDTVENNIKDFIQLLLIVPLSGEQRI